MAFLTPGPLGRPSGKIGNMVYYTLNGKVVSRMIGKQDQPATKSQLANRQAMRVTMNLLRPMQRFIKLGFEHKAKGTAWNAFNIATSYNKTNALKGAYPYISVDYSKVILSAGSLPLAKDIQLSKTTGGLLLTWNPEHHYQGDQYDDLVMVALYSPCSKNAKIYLNAGKRREGRCFIPVIDKILNEPLESYICFKSAYGGSISDSLYLGNLNGEDETEEQKEINRQHKLLRSRFAQVQADYLRHEALFAETGVKNKAMRHTKKEYQVLKAQVEKLPQKPV